MMRVKTVHGVLLPRSSTRGMTLVEMLVAMAASLLIMSAVAQVFGVLGRTVSSSANVQEMNGDLRSVARLLRQDLNGITVDPNPPVSAAKDLGYLEIVEGTAKDGATVAADYDDVLMFTSTNLAEPFRGIVDDAPFQSQSAEIAWFCSQSVNQPLASMGITLYTLYRRQLLVSGYVGQSPFQTENRADFSTFDSLWSHYFSKNDISVRNEGGVLYPNSLGDLVKPRCRFLHTGAYPGFAFAGASADGAIFSTAGGREGADVVLTNVIGFDVRVYDPLAPVQVSNSVPVSPGDPGFSAGGAVAARGAYVDLGWGSQSFPNPILVTAAYPPTGQSYFQGVGVSLANSQNPATYSLPTYSTWSTHYETNGQNDDDDPIIDQGRDGLDSNSNGLVDEDLERETSAPYPVRLRAIEIRIRCCDPRSRQIRQTTVRHAFVPH
jgi:prepilin-type N-terminal cleavage/methylation domain-containing protein